MREREDRIGPDDLSNNARLARGEEPSRGGEPAIVRRIRDAIGHWEDTGNHVAFGYSMQELRDLLAFIDRPTPAASVPSEPTLHERVVEAQAALLKADNEIITELEAERDRLKARGEELEERCKTIADENGGPHPVQSAEEALTCIEQEFAKRHRESEALRQELDSKHAQLVEVADKLNAVGQELHVIRQYTLSGQADLYIHAIDGAARRPLEALGPPRTSIPKTPDAPDTRHAVIGAVADALPTNAEDEKLIDGLMAKRAAGLVERAMKPELDLAQGRRLDEIAWMLDPSNIEPPPIGDVLRAFVEYLREERAGR